MPKPKGYIRKVPHMYQFQHIDLIIFGYVQALRKIFPDLSTTKAIKITLSKLDLCEEVYCFNNCKSAYYRVLRASLKHDFKKE
jgi:hypothetical protein